MVCAITPALRTRPIVAAIAVMLRLFMAFFRYVRDGRVLLDPDRHQDSMHSGCVYAVSKAQEHPTGIGRA